MVDVLSLDLVEKRCIADQLVLYVRYSKDWYGRKVPKHTHGSATFSHFTSSSHIVTQAVLTRTRVLYGKDLPNSNNKN